MEAMQKAHIGAMIGSWPETECSEHGSWQQANNLLSKPEATQLRTIECSID